jgi:uncharacterized protein (TIGR03083 family)
MNRLHATKDFWLAALRADSPALQDAVAQAGAGAEVPSCPGWTGADLVEHLTSELRWVRETTARGVTDRPEQIEVAPRPEWEVALDGLRRELTGTIETLEALDADLPAWNWAPQAKKASFWQRRMAHEISVHRWDAESAAGRATPIETKLAADGVNEVLDTWLPAGRGTDGAGLTGVVGLVATDGGHEFFVRERPDGGVALLDTGTLLDTEPHERVVATGPASDILLVLYGRLDADVLEISGEARLLDALRVG